MTRATSKLDQVRAALRGEPRARASDHPISLAFEGETLILEGEVADVAAKKCALERVAADPGVAQIVDRLHVAPLERQEDGLIRDSVCAALIAEPAFAEISVGAWNRAP